MCGLRHDFAVWQGFGLIDRSCRWPRCTLPSPRHPPPTLTELRRRLDCSASSILRAYEPELCDQLAALQKAHVVERRAELERMAAAALKESPAPSIRDLCERLGITVFFMNEYFPAVRRAISENHRRWVSSETARRLKELFANAHNIAIELQGRGVFPSQQRIVEHLPEGSCREWKTIASAVRAAHEALGIPK